MLLPVNLSKAQKQRLLNGAVNGKSVTLMFKPEDLKGGSYKLPIHGQHAKRVDKALTHNRGVRLTFSPSHLKKELRGGFLDALLDPIKAVTTDALMEGIEVAKAPLKALNPNVKNYHQRRAIEAFKARKGQREASLADKAFDLGNAQVQKALEKAEVGGPLGTVAKHASQAFAPTYKEVGATFGDLFGFGLKDNLYDAQYFLEDRADDIGDAGKRIWNQITKWGKAKQGSTEKKLFQSLVRNGKSLVKSLYGLGLVCPQCMKGDCQKCKNKDCLGKQCSDYIQGGLSGGSLQGGFFPFLFFLGLGKKAIDGLSGGRKLELREQFLESPLMQWYESGQLPQQYERAFERFMLGELNANNKTVATLIQRYQSGQLKNDIHPKPKPLTPEQQAQRQKVLQKLENQKKAIQLEKFTSTDLGKKAYAEASNTKKVYADLEAKANQTAEQKKAEADRLWAENAKMLAGSGIRIL